jgi:hypothetical protein
MARRPVFYASGAILGLLRGTFYWRPVFVNTANHYQKWWYGLRRALRRERDCPATGGIAQAIFQSVILYSSGQICGIVCLSAAALLRVTDKP